MIKRVFVGCLVLVCGSLTAGCTSAQDSADKPQVALHAHLLVGQSIVRITNDDTFAWKNAKIQLNPEVGVDSTDYYGMQVSSWPAGTQKTLMLAEFTKGGTHYNPASAKVTEVVIRCDMPGGSSSGYYDATLST